MREVGAGEATPPGPGEVPVPKSASAAFARGSERLGSPLLRGAREVPAPERDRGSALSPVPQLLNARGRGGCVHPSGIWVNPISEKCLCCICARFGEVERPPLRGAGEVPGIRSSLRRLPPRATRGRAQVRVRPVSAPPRSSCSVESPHSPFRKTSLALRRPRLLHHQPLPFPALTVRLSVLLGVRCVRSWVLPILHHDKPSDKKWRYCKLSQCGR